MALCTVATAQSQLTDANTAASTATCNPWKPQVFSTNLSFAERSCLGFSELVSPSVFLAAGMLSGYARFHMVPHHNESYSIAERFEHVYERKAARITGEVLVGYLHHEDPRPHFSGKQGAWRRTGAALWSVLDSPDQNGKGRLALAPLAGSLGSGLSTMALYQHQNSFGYGLERSGFIYSHYFIGAVFHEFSPELWSLAPRFIRKYHNTTVSNGN
jgi:hypothetical protein